MDKEKALLVVGQVMAWNGPATVVPIGVPVGFRPVLPDTAALSAGHQAWLMATDDDLTPRSRLEPARAPVPPATRPTLGVARNSRRRLVPNADTRRGGGWR